MNVTETPEDWAEVRQQEEYKPTNVPVVVCGPVTTRDMPAKRGVGRTIPYDQLVNIPQPFELIPADPRIKTAWVVTAGTNCVVGTREQVTKAGAPDGFLMPANQALPWSGFEEPLFAVANAASAGTISVRFEYWAD